MIENVKILSIPQNIIFENTDDCIPNKQTSIHIMLWLDVVKMRERYKERENCKKIKWNSNKQYSNTAGQMSSKHSIQIHSIFVHQSSIQNELHLFLFCSRDFIYNC